MQAHYIPEHKFPFELSPGIMVLGNYFFNLFLIRGAKKNALFEVGISATVDVVIRKLEGLGIRPDYLICSHPHSDHITGLPGLTEHYPEARLIAAKGAGEFIRHPKAGPLLFKDDAFMSNRLADFGITPGRPPLAKVPDLGSADLVHDRLSLDLGGRCLDLVRVDGHSPGNLIAMLPDQKILFSSDSLGFHFPGRGFLPLFFTGTSSYLSVLMDIQSFSPSIVCPAHQGPLKGAAAAAGVQESLDTTIQFINDIQNSDHSDEIMADRIFKAHYKDEFTLYTMENIKNCAALLVKRAKEAPSGI